jgi:ATP-binding cassette, subfamily B, bacterial
VLIVLVAAVSAAPPLLIRAAIDDAIPTATRACSCGCSPGLLGVAVVVAAISMVERWLSSSIGEELILDLRTMLYRHVQTMPIAFFTRTQTGALITRLNNDVIGAQRALTGTLGGIVDNLIGVTVTLSVMLALEWRVTLIAVALLPVFVIPARIVGRRLQALSRESMGLNAEMNSVMTERFHVAGALLVKLFGRIDREVDLFHDKADRVARIGVRQALAGRALFASLGLDRRARDRARLPRRRADRDRQPHGRGRHRRGARPVRHPALRPLAQLSNARVDLMTALVSFERVFEVLDLPRPIDERPDARALTAPRGHVTFEHVWFRYPAAAGSSLESLEGPRSEHGDEASDWILRDIDLDVPPGDDGRDRRAVGGRQVDAVLARPPAARRDRGPRAARRARRARLTLDSVADAVGVVSQDPHLFHDSIAANLRYARPDASDEELVRAATAARIHHVIARLPDGYDTIVGERGYRLSGGEKQRLSIARVLLKDPAVVVLDEATAHLDTESERLVQAALAETLRDRTSLVIAHRLSTVVDADLIVVLDEGASCSAGRTSSSWPPAACTRSSPGPSSWPPRDALEHHDLLDRHGDR